MRIVVSGTHASGKSTLISDFAAQRPEYERLPDPFELIDESSDEPSARTFVIQLRIAAERLSALQPSDDVIAERGPLDFLAYLLALEELGRAEVSADLLERSRELTADAMRRVDLLVLLPLAAPDLPGHDLPGDARIWVSDDEDLELRATMNDTLLELSDDPDLVTGSTRVEELSGAPADRARALEAAVRPAGRV